MAYSYGTELSIDFASVLLLMINWVNIVKVVVEPREAGECFRSKL